MPRRFKSQRSTLALQLTDDCAINVALRSHDIDWNRKTISGILLVMGSSSVWSMAADAFDLVGNVSSAKDFYRAYTIKRQYETYFTMLPMMARVPMVRSVIVDGLKVPLRGLLWLGAIICNIGRLSDGSSMSTYYQVFELHKRHAVLKQLTSPSATKGIFDCVAYTNSPTIRICIDGCNGDPFMYQCGLKGYENLNIACPHYVLPEGPLLSYTHPIS
jgi:hypothetical protein